MPIRKFRSVEAMNQPVWREPGDPELYRAIRALWEEGRKTFPRQYPPGVHRYRSVEEMETAAEQWRQEAFERFQAARTG